jgi:hypothetical protein
MGSPNSTSEESKRKVELFKVQDHAEELENKIEYGEDRHEIEEQQTTEKREVNSRVRRTM